MRFLRFLEKVGAKNLASFSTQDLLVLDLIHRDKSIRGPLKERLSLLLNQGIIEKVGHGRGTKFILSRAFYEFIGQKGIYTQKRGLDRGTQKELLLKHLRENASKGSRLKELRDVLPQVSRGQIQVLLGELKKEKWAYSEGRTNAARWYPRELPSGA